MPKGDKSTEKDKQKRRAGAVESEQKSGARPEAGARAWVKVNKVHGGAKQIATGRKIPSGPVGGLGRKTNLSRSS